MIGRFRAKAAFEFYSVSIPLWDDWKGDRSGQRGHAPRFQFHYGMIGSYLGFVYGKLVASFNSTMGWLEGPNEPQPIANSQVSIPLWDDWKLHGIVQIAMAEVVSIPLWDDWKLFKFCLNLPLRSFNSTMGWLEVGQRYAGKYDVMFQFHYGMIGSAV